MLRSNLATRPFYNERMVRVVLGLAAALVLVLTAFNAIRIVALSGQNTEFSTLIGRDRGEAERLTEEARRIRAGINQEELKRTVEAAERTNRLIDQRTFSWTEFFNHIEETLPPDVMLTAVQPSFDNRRSEVRMTVLGRSAEDIDLFIQKLEATSVFHQVLPVQQDETEDGLHRVLLHSEYAGPGSAPAGSVPPASGPQPEPMPPAGEAR
jgi:Tfp pilus assembly protein PilN